MPLRFLLPLALGALLAACGGSNTDSGVESPGAGKSAKTATLEAGAAALQDKPPLDALNAYLDGFISTAATCRPRWRRTTTARC
ncbi:hypothetical protein [Variovorax sp. DXTD-1]|uniref:hypothetical protein n=1 Tax=Variovorax sp. DXTD-1 TaxID=2495592 RepID=UPI0021AEF6D1|nr:hypothetical protein [Variovorax sp. DXTD-1]